MRILRWIKMHWERWVRRVRQAHPPNPTQWIKGLGRYFNSLQVRLPVMMLLVVLVAVAVTAYFAQQGTTGVFYQFTAMSAQRDQTIVANLLTDAGEKGQINQLQIEKLGQNFGQPIFLVSQGGDVLVASDPAQVGVKITEPLPTIATKIIYDAKPTYLLMRSAVPMPGMRQDVMTWVSAGEPAPQLGPVSLGTFTVPAAGAGVNSFPVAGAAGNVTFEEPNTLQRFVQSINRSFLISVAGALALTTVLTFGLSRRILTPVQALKEAARKLEKGDLGQRVRVRSKDEIGELAHAFNSMADGLSRADQLRRNMVSDVAHELRTPLANVRGYLEAMWDGVVQASPATIDSLYEETLLLSRMVDDLQELALAEAGQLRLANEVLEPAELVAAAVTATQAQASQKGIVLKAEIAPSLPTLTGDGQRLGQALRNLITNAIAHTPEGGTILVKADTTSEGVALSVQDTGDGIAAEHLPFIFERFYRADPARQRIKGGSGLGLAIVKQWVAAHGGAVEAKSTGVAGEGSTVTMWLPTTVKAEGGR